MYRPFLCPFSVCRRNVIRNQSAVHHILRETCDMMPTKGVVIMSEIVHNTKRNLKNIEQIGSPEEEDKIYIEKNAYDRLHREELSDRRVFVLMGHTECTNGKYTTFVEAAVPVSGIVFVQNIPRWNNNCWSSVFQEIKRAYEDAIIVGWAVDIKGMPPKLSMELEAVHKEQFGGRHQLLFLMDTVEKEEYFYISRNHHLMQKRGFYIYYEPERIRQAEDYGSMEDHVQVEMEIPDWRTESRVQPRYRQMMNQRKRGWDWPNDRTQERKQQKMGSYRSSSLAMSAAAVLLVGMIGVGAYRTRNQIYDLQHVLQTMSLQKDTETSGPQKTDGTGQTTEKQENTIDSTQKAAEAEQSTQQDVREETDQKQEGGDRQNGTVPVERVPGIDKKNQETDAALTQPASGVIHLYTVKKGDTLRLICQTRYGNLDKLKNICDLNGITDPDAIQEGQELKMPDE